MGKMHLPDYLPLEAQPGLSTQSGEFDFESATPGLYFLSLRPSGETNRPGGEIVGQIAVAVEPEAPVDHLGLDLGWTSCGLFYTDRSQCPQGDFEIQQLSGRVLDASGAAIANAKILLIASDDHLVERP